MVAQRAPHLRGCPTVHARSQEAGLTDPEGPVEVGLYGVTKRFGDMVAVDDVTITVGRGEFFSMLGPSGCGKTTSLRMIAGFEEPDADGSS